MLASMEAHQVMELYAYLNHKSDRRERQSSAVEEARLREYVKAKMRRQKRGK